MPTQGGLTAGKDHLNLEVEEIDERVETINKLLEHLYSCDNYSEEEVQEYRGILDGMYKGFEIYSSWEPETISYSEILEKCRHVYFNEGLEKYYRNRVEELEAELEELLEERKGLVGDTLTTVLDYHQALIEVEHLFNAPLNTPEGGRLQTLIKLIEAYEEVHHLIDPPITREEE